MKLYLRPERADDEAFLLRLYASTRADELAHVCWDEAQKQAFVSMQFDAQRKYYRETYVGASFDIIEVGGSAIGRVYVDRRQDEIRVVDISLVPEARNHGVGSEILKTLLAEAARTRRRVTVHVEHSNAAMQLYLRLGFRPSGDKVGVYHFLEALPTASS